MTIKSAKCSILIEAATMKMVAFDEEITLESLYKKIGCNLVEVVYPARKVSGFRNPILICDEEALYNNNPILNVMASMIAGQKIHGNVVVCESEDFK